MNRLWSGFTEELIFKECHLSFYYLIGTRNATPGTLGHQTPRGGRRKPGNTARLLPEHEHLVPHQVGAVEADQVGLDALRCDHTAL